jgi:orotate phosphoribosyltransferase
MEMVFESLSESNERLKKLIREKALTFGRVTLASGGESDFFFDMKMVSMDPEGSNLIADALLEILKKEDVDYVGGLESGAIPIVSTLCTKSWLKGTPISGFFVRKEPKKRGTMKLIEGNLEKNSKVILVDDVTTRGGSVLKAVNEVREQNCKVDKVITVVDRMAGARENLKKYDIELVALFTKKDFDL